jgi:hypothetical protein
VPIETAEWFAPCHAKPEEGGERARDEEIRAEVQSKKKKEDVPAGAS